MPGLLGNIQQNLRGLLSELDPRSLLDFGKGQSLQEAMQNRMQPGSLRPNLSPNQMVEAGLNIAGMAPVGMTVWHGSPHKFDKFDMSKIGTGEGAQAYGHGLYMAEAPDVAKQYAEGLSNGKFKNAMLYRISGSPRDGWGIQVTKATDDYNAGTPFLDFNQVGGDFKSRRDALRAIESDSGLDNSRYKIKRQKSGEGYYTTLEVTPRPQLYKVDIPDESIPRMLDWDKPLSEQAPEVQTLLKQNFNSDPQASYAYQKWLEKNPDAKASKVYQEASFLFGERFVPKVLNKNGIPGIRYLDGGSRNAGEGTSNYVLFDDALARILERNGQATGLNPWQPREWKGLLK